MITRQNGFHMADRYYYDFKVCTIANDWAQIDTSQDASYFGTWINPEKRQIFQYVEGDTYITKCDTDEELKAEVIRMRDWNVENGHRFLGIDPSMNDALKNRLVSAGLEEFLH